MTRTDVVNGKNKTVKYQELRKKERNVVDTKVELKKFAAGDALKSGDYTWPFQVTFPNECPASFFWAGK